MQSKVKKLYAVLMLVSFIFASVSPVFAAETAEKNFTSGGGNTNFAGGGCTLYKKDVNYVKGVWFTYMELGNMLSGGDFAAKFTEAAENCKALGITDIFVHVRPYCNSLYPSKYFPQIESAKKYNFDVLEYIVSQAHQRGIRVHGWINPYRVRTADNNISELPKDSPAYIWLNNDTAADDDNVCVTPTRIWLNPASADVRKLCFDEIREILSLYKLDGIHFDDYFYPGKSPVFDKKSYEKYKAAAANPMKLEDWRRKNVDMLVSGCKRTVKECNKDVIFSVSPVASNDEAYNICFADVQSWIKNEWTDWLIPQIYYGYEYPDSERRFGKLMTEWQNKVKGSSVKLIIGLAPYKIGIARKPDRDEWAKGDEVIFRQVKDCVENKNIFGHVFFSYSWLFSEKELNKSALRKIKKINCRK